MSKFNKLGQLGHDSRTRPNPADGATPVAPGASPGAAPTTATPPLEVPKRKGRQPGRKSDPTYTQIGPFVPIELHNQVKIYCIQNGTDISMLVETLLRQHLAGKDKIGD